jgi:hypothetical protein
VVVAGFGHMFAYGVAFGLLFRASGNLCCPAAHVLNNLLAASVRCCQCGPGILTGCRAVPTITVSGRRRATSDRSPPAIHRGRP